MPGLRPRTRSLDASLSPLRRRVESGRRLRSRRPLGALIAGVIVVAVHLLASLAVYPDPQPRRDLRRKVVPLTAHVRPQLIVCGDSRAESGFIPSILATEAGMAPDLCVNIATPACELAGGLAAWQVYADRFAGDPIVIANVSLFSVNDRAANELVGQETLWSLGLLDRLGIVPPQRALAATFLPEREALNRWALEPLLLSWDYSKALAAQGYRGKTKHPPVTVESVREGFAEFDRRWLNDPMIDGARWELLEANVRAFRERGAQLVLVDLPEHPLLLEELAQRGLDEVNTRFHAKLAEFCTREGVPLLRYTADRLDPTGSGSLFVSVVHLNRGGAERLSALAGRELRTMLSTGVLRVPAGQ